MKVEQCLLVPKIRIREGEEPGGTCVCCETGSTSVCCKRKVLMIIACCCGKEGERGTSENEGGEDGGLIKGKSREVCAKI